MAGKKFIVLCLEGLSESQFEQLATKLPNLRQLRKSSFLSKFSAGQSHSIQSTWAELLWGIPWFELNVAGYSRPRSTLNDVAPIRESDLPMPCPLFRISEHSIAVNIPLLAPADGRYWLADGSLPFGCSVHPTTLLSQEPFDSYKPRAFSSAPFGLARFPQSAYECLAVESNRLECASSLMNMVNWKICLVRLTAFDQLLHLLGEDFLTNKGGAIYSRLAEFLNELDTWIGSTIQTHVDRQMLLISTTSHTNCTARVNLNGFLAEGGFCKLIRSSGPKDLNHQRRRAASQLSSNNNSEGTRHLTVTPNWTFDLDTTLCGSPVAGAVYLNRQDRFSNGIVTRTDIQELSERVSRFLTESIRQTVGRQPDIRLAKSWNELGPELVISLAGVEFHNSAIGPVVDTIDKPRSTHCSEGFAVIPQCEASKDIGPLELHSMLAGI